MIKVEHPVRGDDTRAWGPPYAKYKDGADKEGPGESAYYLAVCQDQVIIHFTGTSWANSRAGQP